MTWTLSTPLALDAAVATRSARLQLTEAIRMRYLMPIKVHAT